MNTRWYHCLVWRSKGALNPRWFMLPIVLRRWSRCNSYFVWHCGFYYEAFHEPPHDKTNKVAVLPAKTQISLGIRPVWSESSLCTHWVAKDPSFLHADSEDSDQTGRMPRLIWFFAGRTVILLVLRRLLCWVLPYSLFSWCFQSWLALWSPLVEMYVYLACVTFCLFLFLFVSGVGCRLWLWHFLDFSFNLFLWIPGLDFQK